MDARHKFRRLTGTRTEAELLGKLRTCRRSCSRVLWTRLKVFGGFIAELAVCLKRLLCTSAARAAVCSSVQSECSVFPLNVITPRGPDILSLWYALCGTSLNLANAVRPSSAIATAERDDTEYQLLTSEVVRGSEDHFQCD